MKKISVLILLLFAASIVASAQIDTVTAKRVDQLSTKVSDLKKSIDTILTKIEQPVKPSPPYSLDTAEKLYVFLPIVLFLILFFIMLRRLRLSGFNFAKAMEGDTPIAIDKINPAATPGNTQPSTISVSQVDVNGDPVMPKSSSRLLAFFSGMAALTVALCLVSYYVYFGIRGTNAPSMDGLLEAVLGLGIGIVPYAMNKITQSK